MLSVALHYRKTLQGARHRDAATSHLKMADVHWLHRDFGEALKQLDAAHSIFLHIADEMDYSGSREVAKVKSLLVVALVWLAIAAGAFFFQSLLSIVK